MSSSLFPFLRSLLILPLKSDLHSVTLHQTIEDRDRGGFTTPDRQQDHLSFHDTGLRGSEGAQIVLEALATNPFAHRLTLSHNQLGDLGVRQLSSRVRFLQNRRTVPVHELNLASNSLTDLALGDLCRSWDGLTELFLSNNLIDLRSRPSPMLDLRSLSLLSLTSNPIDCRSLSDLLRQPNFGAPELATLHLSACNLDLSVAVSLALWLEDYQRSRKLEWLAVNGNVWGTFGCERITWALARKGGNCNLLRLEMLACGSPPSASTNTSNDTDQTDHLDHHAHQHDLMGFRDPQDVENCRRVIQAHSTWNQLLEKCEFRNQALRLATRRAALGLVSSARVILLSSPAPPPSSNKDQDNVHQGTFAWNRLPEEIKLKIWKWVSILSAFPGLKPSPENLSVSAQGKSKDAILSDEPSSLHNNGRSRKQFVGHYHDGQQGASIYDEFPDPLSPIQLRKALEYASDRTNLEREITQREQVIFDHQLEKTSSFHRQLVHNDRLELEIDRLGRAFLLKSCDAHRFLGSL